MAWGARNSISTQVNPRAGHETSLELTRTMAPLNVAVVGAGPAGLSAACALGERGHRVTLFEQAERVGGQFLLAAAVPGKEEFWETLRYFRTMLDVFHVDVRLNTYVDAATVKGFDRVVVSTAVHKSVAAAHLRSWSPRHPPHPTHWLICAQVHGRAAAIGRGPRVVRKRPRPLVRRRLVGRDKSRPARRRRRRGRHRI